MLVDWNLFKQDCINYIYWLKRKTFGFDYASILLFYRAIGIVFIFENLSINAVVGDLMFGSLIVSFWTFNLIPIPWIAEQTNISRYKTTDKKEIKTILRTRLLEQIILVECFQAFFMGFSFNRKFSS